jgi:signal peptidase II
MSYRYKLFAIVAFLSLVFDQATKIYARAQLTELGDPVPFIKPVWYWDLSYNTGSAFGLFQGTSGARIFLSLIGVVALVVIVMILRKGNDTQKWMTTALAMVAGGAVGNVIDRLWMGKVTDFVLWQAGKHRWPAFNVADVALVAGVIILFLDIGKDQKRAKLAKEQAKAAAAGGKK